MTAPFSDRLALAVQAKDSSLVVGLDPVLERLPACLVPSRGDVRQRASRAFAAFAQEVIQAIAPHACAIKPQIAFFEEWGPPGIEAFEQTIRIAHQAGLLVIADVKRGDIGSTAAAYARAYFDPSRGGPTCDALTLNPYLGTDSVQPFLDAAETNHAGLFVLVRTSNPSARELQDLSAAGSLLHEHVARLVSTWGQAHMGACGYSGVGAVVGATAPRELAHLRSCLPHAWLLIPGVGAQGASPADVACAFDKQGLGAVVNASRSVIYAYDGPGNGDWTSRIAAAARSLRDDLRVVAHSVQGA